MPTKLLMLDSGAFAVWAHTARARAKAKAKNEEVPDLTIDLDAYIAFCKEYEEISYYVNLDVIPGEPFDKKTLRPVWASRRKQRGLTPEEACKKGWENYLRMVKRLPEDKVIPVYHQGDPLEWLETYIGYGCPYVGISPANDRTTGDKIEWVRSLRPLLFREDGSMRIRTHGFAVTSFDLMGCMSDEDFRCEGWYSVDSASWKLAAAWGAIYVPRTTGGVWDYSRPPLQYVVSPQTLHNQRRGHHCRSVPKEGKEHWSIHFFLNECKAKMGKYREVEKKEGYVPDKSKGEFLIKTKEVLGKPTREVIGVVEEEGVTTSFAERARVTAEFVRRANKALPVKHIYFAGAPMPLSYDLETRLGNRLLSYHDVGNKSKGESKCLRAHLDSMKGDGK